VGTDKWNPDFRFNRQFIMNETGTAPCKVACPAHISIEGYIELAKEGRYAEALELIKKKNPFPAVCGRVCNKRCEDACTRGTIGDKTPVSIDEIKKFVAQLDLDEDTRVKPRDPASGIPRPQDGSHRRGPGGLKLRLLSRRNGLHRHRLRKREEARRHVDP
jgi:hypothetical protein